MTPDTRHDTIALFVDHVTHVDCGVLDAAQGLRGATWLVDAVLEGERDEHGMLFDFGPAKKLLKAEIDALIDHRLLIPQRAPGLQLSECTATLACTNGDHYRYEGPSSAMCALDCAELTPDWLADWLAAAVAPRLPANVRRLSLSLREERIEGPVYDYTHGLSAHDGNCQRLAHGHRCRLSIALDGTDRPDLATAWATAWQGVFIGSRAHLTTPADADRLGFAYAAPQGRFALEIAAARCVLLDAPATVENIADHIAQRLARAHPGRHVAVRAYEGVGKGAIASRRID
ncbi:6-carboxytetrahydropterin synthase [Salinisphaera sp. Q1T1-3]|uniref:6-pyruvoyl trahydropterin synthase family protein n=1 Tax=Salinisphaera sp. Q1T1-3 TaxID=2321229 RepID=UPI000E75F74E|nr:6-carboxytetrahydropterin synthase [Salinisphaera sp. Q1T1-3]RJS93361.1 hypothetical protein D3260_08800 [Salinisphaera sp. Q1T1-3]